MRLRATVLHSFLLSTLLVPGSATTHRSGGEAWRDVEDEMRREGCSVPSVASLEAALHSTDPRCEVERQAQMLLKQQEARKRGPSEKETARLGSPELVQLLDSGLDLDLQAGRDPWQVDSQSPIWHSPYGPVQQI